MNIQTYATELETRGERFADFADQASTEPAHFGFTVASELYGDVAALLQARDVHDPAIRLALANAYLETHRQQYESILMHPNALRSHQTFHLQRPYTRTSDRAIVTMFGPALGVVNAMIEELSTGELQ